MLKIIKDKEPIYDTDQFDVVLMGVSIYNVFLGNFQGKMGIKYPVISDVNQSTAYADTRKLGKRITITETKPIISLMYICKWPSKKDNFIDYEALKNCLKTANSEFKGKKVMSTIIGSSRFDGRGDRDKCLQIIEECTKNLDLTLYDYNQITFKEEIKRQKAYFKNIKKKYKGDKEKLAEIKELEKEMRIKTYLPPLTTQVNNFYKNLNY